MSTQGETGITFALLPEEQQQHYRLLEFPPELLSLLTSDNPAKYARTTAQPSVKANDISRLQFKSQEAPPTQAVESNAVLCTPSKTYNIRQVNTSNSVFVTRPVEGERDPGGGTQAVAQSNFTLELSPASNVSAAPYLEAALPTYSSSGHAQPREAPVSKEELFKNIPLSDAECEQAWTELTCFELHHPPACFLPTAKAKVAAWRSILNAAIVSGVDLTSISTEEQMDRIIDEDDDRPVELSRAVLRSVSTVTDGDTVKVDEDRCIRRVGLNELESRTGYTPTADFTKAWADALPEKWRDKARLELLEGKFAIDGQQITAVENAVPSKAGANGEAAGAKSSLGAKRKWHDKFRASKKAA